MLQYDSNKTYAIDDLFLYLPKKTQGTVYCRLVDAELGECIVKLGKIKTDGNYDIYQVTLENHITVQPGLCQIYFLIIQYNKIKSTTIKNIYLNFDNFSAANKLFLMEKTLKEIKNLATQTEQYAKLSVQIYKDIREVAGIND